VTSVLQIYRIPTSCCRDETDETICRAAVETGVGAQISNAIYSEVSICFVSHPLVNPFWMAAGNALGSLPAEVMKFEFCA
jgi:hypothetical protein